MAELSRKIKAWIFVLAVIVVIIIIVLLIFSFFILILPLALLLLIIGYFFRMLRKLKKEKPIADNKQHQNKKVIDVEYKVKENKEK